MDASCTLLFLLVEGKERIGAWGWEGGYSVRNVMSDNFLIPQISISVLLGNVTWLYDHNGNRKFFWKLTKIFRKGHLFWTDENVSERDPNLHCWTKLQFNWKLEKQTNTTPPPPHYERTRLLVMVPPCSHLQTQLFEPTMSGHHSWVKTQERRHRVSAYWRFDCIDSTPEYAETKA